MDASFREIALDRLNAMVNKGKERAAAVINQVMTVQPKDFLVKAKALKFVPGDGGVHIENDSFGSMGFHRNALGQAAAKAGIPLTYVDRLSNSDWGMELLADNMNKLFAHANGDRYLMRAVDGEVRGFLSDRYRRLDSRPIVEAFVGALQQRGALPYEGYALDTKVSIQAIYPELHEPIPGEIIAFGASLENSDFGNGALSIRDFVLRLICRNGAVGRDVLRQVHLGKRLTGDIQFSDDTFEADGRTVMLAVRDTTNHILSPTTINGYLEGVKAAAGEKIDGKSATEILRKALPSKGDVERVTEAYNSPDIEMLPAGNNMWRLSNAISWVAVQTENEEKRLELQHVAGELLKAA